MHQSGLISCCCCSGNHNHAQMLCVSVITIIYTHIPTTLISLGCLGYHSSWYRNYGAVLWKLKIVHSSHSHMAKLFIYGLILITNSVLINILFIHKWKFKLPAKSHQHYNTVTDCRVFYNPWYCKLGKTREGGTN
jgi:hypothetical protein